MTQKKDWDDYQQPGPVFWPFLTAQPPNRGSENATFLVPGPVEALGIPPISMDVHTLLFLGEQLLEPSVANADWTAITIVAANIDVVGIATVSSFCCIMFHNSNLLYQF